MIAKRRDNKNRVLRNGESQLKNGKYCYKYIVNGKSLYAYSWRLEISDRTPQGKKNDIPLREKVKQINKDITDGIGMDAQKTSVLQLVEKYYRQRNGISNGRKEFYRYVINLLKKYNFGDSAIDKVKQSDAKNWLIELQNDGRCYGTVKEIAGIVKSSFKIAVDDDLIRKNPFSFK